MRRSTVDYDEAARKLFASLGLDATGATPEGLRNNIYNPMDLVFHDKATGGKIFVGNQSAAQNAALLQREGVTHVVNCTDSMPFYHERTFEYKRFNVTFWPSESLEALTSFMAPMLEFVDKCVASGGGVLVHCLAGAHRAGTTGCMLLMHKCGLSAAAAVAAAKQLRPVIDPIGRFPELLRQFERINGQKRLAASQPK